ncbi:MAG: hypothetical protein QOF72_3053 [Blastocatellia bacterium]|nr:hypothetical protein [Blastocatellia bacterium]
MQLACLLKRYSALRCKKYQAPFITVHPPPVNRFLSIAILLALLREEQAISRNRIQGHGVVILSVCFL